ncbi:hypothetical protein L484_024661 [Morus notabilis]|uniref:Uncharacterized protein n=1 Tax=Morus notabilis TaxID=981085 RepID=W9R4I9_9ROSA|nr:hypothetical protein L484_024661 [Morus notabilis]
MAEMERGEFEVLRPPMVQNSSKYLDPLPKALPRLKYSPHSLHATNLPRWHFLHVASLEHFQYFHLPPLFSAYYPLGPFS